MSNLYPRKTLADLFSNDIPVIRHSKLLSAEECAILEKLIITAEVVSLSVTLTDTGALGVMRKCW